MNGVWVRKQDVKFEEGFPWYHSPVSLYASPSFIQAFKGENSCFVRRAPNKRWNTVGAWAENNWYMMIMRVSRLNMSFYIVIKLVIKCKLASTQQTKQQGNLILLVARCPDGLHTVSCKNAAILELLT